MAAASSHYETYQRCETLPTLDLMLFPDAHRSTDPHGEKGNPPSATSFSWLEPMRGDTPPAFQSWCPAGMLCKEDLLGWNDWPHTSPRSNTCLHQTRTCGFVGVKLDVNRETSQAMAPWKKGNSQSWKRAVFASFEPLQRVHTRCFHV